MRWILYQRNDRKTTSYANWPAALLALSCSLCMPTPALCDDLLSLELYNGPQVEVVSGLRSPRPASRTAENTTVLTEREIEALNAHTLADLLYQVTGVQLEGRRTPGSATNLLLQGSNFNHVLVLVDNVPLNNLVDNYADVSMIPVQMIERIEVVKGAASSSWGSALGGVINVITKNPQQERRFGGEASASLGSRETADLRAETGGALGSLGYYLTAGRLSSDGLRPNNDSDLKSFYGKLRYDLPRDGEVSFTSGLSRAEGGQLDAGGVRVDQDSRMLFSTLSLRYHLSASTAADFSLRSKQSFSDLQLLNQAETLLIRSTSEDDDVKGASLQLSWLGERHRLAAGVDYDHVKTQLEVPALGRVTARRADRVGVFLIDTVTFGALAVTPSVRFDHTGTGGDHVSPSFGVTYALTENSVLRGYTARGYSLTSVTRSDSTEKIWTSQIGFETGEIPYFWLKGTLFRNETWDINVGTPTGSVRQRQLKQGVEFEGRTLPFLDTSLAAGYTFTSVTEGENGPVIQGKPKHTLKLSAKYDDGAGLQGQLAGNYIHWNHPSGRYGAIIWDLFLRKELVQSDIGSVQLFFSVRNLLNDEQYLDSLWRSTGRWVEAGVKCAF